MPLTFATLIVTSPAGFAVPVIRLPTMRGDEMPGEARKFTLDAPLNVKEPIFNTPELPFPGLMVAAALSLITTVLTVPTPASVPVLTVTVGVIASVLAWRSVAPGPLIVMPLLPLI